MSNEIKSDSGSNVAIVGIVIFATVILVGGFVYMNSNDGSAAPASTPAISASEDDNKLKIELKTDNGSIEYQEKSD